MFITLKKWRAIVMCILLSVPFTLVNFSGYLKGNIPSVFQAISSIVFLLIWFIIALSMSQKNMDIIKISSWFWGGGAILSFLGYFTEIGFIYIPALLIFAGPLYGLRYFLRIPSDIYLVLLSIAIAYVVSIVGGIIGINRNLNKQYAMKED